MIIMHNYRLIHGYIASSVQFVARSEASKNPQDAASITTTIAAITMSTVSAAGVLALLLSTFVFVRLYVVVVLPRPPHPFLLAIPRSLR